MPRRSLIGRAGIASFAAMALVLTACGDDSTDDTAGGASSEPLPTVSADEALAAMVPEAIAEDGVISVGSDTTYPPAEFIDEDGSTIIGFDVDLFTLVAQKLGLEAEFQTAPFDSLIAGVASGRYEAGVSSFTINPERAAQVDMISYFNAGTQWSTKKGNPQGVDIDSACGLKIAVQKATVQVDDLTARSEACTAAGEEAITIDQYDGQDEATAAIVSGKDDAGLADLPVMVYAVQQTDGELELLGDPYGAAPYGYTIKQGQDQFGEALVGALQALIDDGTYEQVLARWGVEAGAIDDPAVTSTGN